MGYSLVVGGWISAEVSFDAAGHRCVILAAYPITYSVVAECAAVQFAEPVDQFETACEAMCF